MGDLSKVKVGDKISVRYTSSIVIRTITHVTKQSVTDDNGQKWNLNGRRLPKASKDWWTDDVATEDDINTWEGARAIDRLSNIQSRTRAMCITGYKFIDHVKLNQLLDGVSEIVEQGVKEGVKDEGV